jgi:hypothetical protein
MVRKSNFQVSKIAIEEFKKLGFRTKKEGLQFISNNTIRKGRNESKKNFIKRIKDIYTPDGYTRFPEYTNPPTRLIKIGTPTYNRYLKMRKDAQAKIERQNLINQMIAQEEQMEREYEADQQEFNRLVREMDRFIKKYPIYIRLNTFIRYNRWRIIYANEGQGTYEDMYDNINLFMYRQKKLSPQAELVFRYLIVYIRKTEPDGTSYISGHKTINADDIYDVESLQATIQDIFTVGLPMKTYTDEEENSDILPDTEYSIELSRFDIRYEQLVNIGSGEMGNMKLFKTHNIISDGLCVYESLKKIKDDIITLDEFKSLKLKNIDNLLKYIGDNNLQINILLASLKYKNKLFDIKNKQEYFMKVGANKHRQRKIYKLEIDDDDLIYIGNKHSEPIGTLLIDIEKKHCDLILDNTVELENIYFGQSRTFYKKISDDEYREMKYNNMNMIKENENITMEDVQDEEQQKLKYEIAMNVKTEGSRLIDKIKVTTKYIFFDYETVINWNTMNVLIPYSMTFLVCDEDKLNELLILDKTNDVDKINTYIRSNCYKEVSYDCTRILHEYISNSENTIFQLVSFNGSSFDHYLLYSDLTKFKCENLSNTVWMGSNLLNFKIDNRHSLFDLNRHITCSLKKACEDYDIKICSKKEMKHFDAQQLYDTDPDLLIKKYKNDKLIEDYMIYDVLSLAVLFGKYQKTLNEIESTKEISKKLHDYKTIGSLMITLLNKHTLEQKIELPNFDKDMMQIYKDMQKDKIGGRCQLFNGSQKIDEFVNSLDVCGLYAYVMCVMNVYYPCGKMVKIDSIDKMPKDSIGFFYTDIDQTKLKLKIYPKKEEDGSNNWDTNEIIKRKLISTVKIDHLKKYGAKVTTYEGIYFTEKIKSCELFKILLPLVQMRNKQDTLKKNSDDKYNESMRQTLKLMINVLSGKLLEGLHLNITTIIHNDNAKFENLKLMYPKLEFNEINNDTVIVNYKKEMSEEMKSTKKVYLGILIYDYSQIHMYDFMYSKINTKKLIYTDTDSSKLRKGDFEKWAKESMKIIIPHWKEVLQYDDRYLTYHIYNENDKILGSFEDENKKMTNNENSVSYFLTKKGYFTGNKDNEINKIEAKMIFKGIRKSDIFVDDIDELKGKSQKELYYIYESSPKIQDNYIKLFDHLYEHKKANILTFNFIKNKKSLNLNFRCNIKTIKY